MQDIFGELAGNFEFIIEKARALSKKYGFLPLSTPILEFANLFERNLGGESDVVKKEIYKFQDRGGEELALRPEFTAGVVRAVLENNFKLPSRVFSYGPLFRYDRPQKGRYRQFHQLNFESFGKGGALEDAENILFANNLLCELGLEGKFELELNSLGSAETLEKYKLILIEYFKKNEAGLSALSKARLLKNPIRILDSKEEEDKEICLNAPKISSVYSAKEASEFEKTLLILKEMGVNFRVNEGIVRGLDYYTGVVFEFTTSLLGAQSTILGGGRYDNLVEEMGGQKTPAIGFAAGIERLALLLNERPLEAKTLHILPLNAEFEVEALKLAEKFREMGASVKISSDGNVGKRLEKLSKEAGVNFALVFGANELASASKLGANLFKVKNLNESREVEGDLAFLATILK